MSAGSVSETTTVAFPARSNRQTSISVWARLIVWTATAEASATGEA